MIATPRSAVVVTTPRSLGALACFAMALACSDPGASEAGDDEAAEDSESSEGADTGDADDFVPQTDTDAGISDCDIFAQDCPEGEKCTIYASVTEGAWDTNRCVPVVGDNDRDAPCVYHGFAEGTDDCDAESMCWNLREVDGELVGYCTDFCSGSADDPTCPGGEDEGACEGYGCAVMGNGYMALCLPHCDPLADACPEGTACYWSNLAFVCREATTNVPTGDPCGFANDCAPGNACVSGEQLPSCEGSACCAQLCDLQGADGCAVEGTVCTDYFLADPACAAGACVIPE